MNDPTYCQGCKVHLWNIDEESIVACDRNIFLSNLSRTIVHCMTKKYYRQPKFDFKWFLLFRKRYATLGREVVLFSGKKVCFFRATVKFKDFTEIIFYTKIHKLQNFFHRYINIFASIFLVLIDQKSTKRHLNSQKFRMELHFQNPFAILSGNFHDDCYVNQKGTTPIQDFWKMASGGGRAITQGR